ncbi:C1 family peptidase [Inhella gelatinilytica]|uniref:C1 family peptidase n=1 Tax=Inhella gelatinilytica TaxID=2795030 RepID=A0A931IUP4_9BURK|nr:C1 family peptidase [Inhella gelatinilytica]MBH9552282.1 C1 family peptidase [Inhella gelatinilytica]
MTIAGRRLALDVRPDRLDLRDRPYRPPLGNLPPCFPSDAELAAFLPRYAQAGHVLNQGEDGACTGFGLAAVINTLRFRAHEADAAEPPPRVSPAMLYRVAQLYDEWPGEDYEGSSCRGALKGWHRHGVCRESLWPYLAPGHKPGAAPPLEDPTAPLDPRRNWDVDALACVLGVYYRVDQRAIVDVQAAIRECGALLASAVVHDGWGVDAQTQLSGHADLPTISSSPTPGKGGTHAFALVGYNARGFVVQNSWGPDWGAHGCALLPYEDWLLHGVDAWAFTLGVPRHSVGLLGAGARAARFLLPSPSSPTAVSAGAGELAPDQALRHTVLMNRGLPLRNDITAADARQAVRATAYAHPLVWLRSQRRKKVLVYAMGGPVTEAEALARVRALAPKALARGVYPLFVVGRATGLEGAPVYADAVAARAGLKEPSERGDRLLEAELRAPGGALWAQTQADAARACEDPEGAGRQVAAALKALAAAVPGLEIHLVGHSDGALLLGHLLRRFKPLGLAAASLHLFAPACTPAFALETFKPAVEAGTLRPARWWIHALSEANERADRVGAYGRSWLYLVSRALETAHKTPLIGLARCLDPKTVAPGMADGLWATAALDTVRAWQGFWGAHPKAAQRFQVWAERRFDDGADGVPAAHTAFDRSSALWSLTLDRIQKPRPAQG